MIDDGIHVCIAAGNSRFKIDVPGGPDYNNTILRSGSSEFYHRGSSPFSNDAMIVGNILDSTFGNLDTRSTSSCTGPGCNIWAGGSNIMSCTSNTNKFTDAAYWGNSSFRQTNINGTSMASPQVCGVGALYLQSNPGISPAELRTMIHNDSSTTMPAGTLTGYGSTDNAMGGPQRVLVHRYNTAIPYVNNITGKYNIRN